MKGTHRGPRVVAGLADLVGVDPFIKTTGEFGI